MKILTKKLGKGEIKWRGVVIPRSKTTLFPAPGVEFDLLEAKMAYRVKMDKQSRLRMARWFKQHRTIKPGDEVTFYRQNGTMRVSLSRSFSRPEKETYEWVQEVVEAIRDGEIHGIIRMNKDGFSVEIGEHVKETQVVLGTR